VYSTNPSKREYVLKRSQVVKVHSYYPGYSGSEAKIHWGGTGGYWCWTDCDNIIGGNTLT
jgi:hypothetical protein